MLHQPVKINIPEWHSRTTGRRHTKHKPWPWEIEDLFTVRDEDRRHKLFREAMNALDDAMARVREIAVPSRLQILLADACPYYPVALGWIGCGLRIIISSEMAVVEDKNHCGEWWQRWKAPPSQIGACHTTGEVAGRSEFMDHSWRPKRRAEDTKIIEDLADPRARSWPGYHYEPGSHIEGPSSNMPRAERAAYCKEFGFTEGTVDHPQGEKPEWAKHGKKHFS